MNGPLTLFGRITREDDPAYDPGCARITKTFSPEAISRGELIATLVRWGNLGRVIERTSVNGR
jgi:hypothetical protein